MLNELQLIIKLIQLRVFVLKSIILFLLLCLISANADAALVHISGSGSIVSKDRTIESSNFDIGDLVTFDLIYDSSANVPDEFQGLETLGVFNNSVGGKFTSGEFLAETSIDDGTIIVTNDDPSTNVDFIGAILDDRFAPYFTNVSNNDTGFIFTSIQLSAYGDINTITDDFITNLDLLQNFSNSITIAFGFQNNFAIAQIDPNSINVSTIPIPAGVWMFISGLVCLLVGLRNRLSR